MTFVVEIDGSLYGPFTDERDARSLAAMRLVDGVPRVGVRTEHVNAVAVRSVYLPEDLRHSPPTDQTRRHDDQP